MHHIGFAHGDLKPDNICFDEDKDKENPNTLRLTLIDFGLSH
jgi:tRNA A-37 threonylcarbamoyl transferase component Bud32